MSRLLAMMAVFLLVALAPAAPVPKGAGKPVLYFPVKVGAKWVYRTGYPTGDEEETREVTRVVEKDGEFVVSVRSDDINKRLPDTTVSERGLFFDGLVSNGGKRLTLL